MPLGDGDGMDAGLDDGGCEVADMDEAVYGVRYTLRVDADGKARLAETRD